MEAGQWGPTTLVKFIDNDGNLLTWFASGDRDYNVGEAGFITGTVKQHKEYQGIKETSVSRVNFGTEPEPDKATKLKKFKDTTKVSDEQEQKIVEWLRTLTKPDEYEDALWASRGTNRNKWANDMLSAIEIKGVDKLPITKKNELLSSFSVRNPGILRGTIG